MNKNLPIIKVSQPQNRRFSETNPFLQILEGTAHTGPQIWKLRKCEVLKKKVGLTLVSAPHTCALCKSYRCGYNFQTLGEPNLEPQFCVSLSCAFINGSQSKKHALHVEPPGDRMQRRKEHVHPLESRC